MANVPPLPVCSTPRAADGEASQCRAAPPAGASAGANAKRELAELQAALEQAVSDMPETLPQITSRWGLVGVRTRKDLASKLMATLAP